MLEPDATSSGQRPLFTNRFAALVVMALLAVSAFACCRHLKSQTPPPSASAPTGPRHLYANTIVATTAGRPELERAALDLQQYLAQASGSPFRIESGAQRGIFLLRSDSPDAPADLAKRAADCGRHGFVIRDAGDGRLYIVATSDAGLAFGAYHYLASIGVRFYFPSPRWTIVPQLRDLEHRVDANIKPAFRLRQFVGTGGLGRGLAVDPKADLETRWNVWKVRNGFGEEFHIDGHSGEAFNVRHKQELSEHPEYLASVAGERAAWSKIAKLDPTNPAAVDLFVRDRVEAYRAKRARDPNGPGSFAISVEPADGGGHCDSEECEELGSVSDRDFRMANAVATALNAEFPGAKASLFAYNFHADVPKIDIHPNVYVTIVPYAFRRDGSDAEEFIKAWAKKKTPLSIYDYWSIPDWIADLPTFDYRRTPEKKLRLWRDQHIEGFLGESTYSAGAMGLGWYIAGRLMWNPDQAVAPLEEAFFRDCFGDAAPPMRRMLRRWSNGFALTTLELRASFVDLAQAFKLTKDAAVLARLTDYAGYVQYLSLRADWINATKMDQAAAKRALVLHLWRIHSTAMVDTFRLQQLLLRRDAKLSAELNPTDASLPVWREIEPVTEAAAARWIHNALHRYPELGVQPRSYDGPLRPVAGATSASAAVASTVTLTVVGNNRLLVRVPEAAPEVAFDVLSNAPVTLRWLDTLQNVMSEARFEPSPQPQRFTPPHPASGDYVLAIQTAKTAQATLSMSTALGLELEDFRIPKAVPVPPLYFYVPRSESAVAIYDSIALPEGSGAVLRNASNAVVPLERYDGGRLLIARAPLADRGQVWTLERAVAPNASLQFLNVPQRLALSRDALRVPSSALR